MQPADYLFSKHYSQLSKVDWELLEELMVVNGYGPSGNQLLANLLTMLTPAFKRSNANIHDFTYWQGGDDAQRKKCDYGFYKRLNQDALDTGWKCIYYIPLALIYFGAVRLFGYKYFKYK